MQLHNLQPAKGSVKKKRRVARGEGSGSGTTAGKGNKGQQARTGYQSKKGHEGGQMPIQRRMPKRGFKNNNKIYFKGLNLDVLEGLAEKTKDTNLTLQVLVANGVVNKKDKVKILGRGELKSKISVEAHAFSETASKAIEKVGGTATTVK